MKNIIRTSLLTIILAPLIALADKSTQVYFFGDSDNDTGYFSATTGNCKDWTTDFTVCGTITGDGVTTIGSGYHWVNIFGNRFGTATTSVNSSATNTSNNATTNGGNNYAATGAFINQVNTSTEPGVWSLANQVDRYLLDYGGKADKNALYSFDVTNDLKFTSDLNPDPDNYSTGLYNYIEAASWTSYGHTSDGSFNSDGTSNYNSKRDYSLLVTDYVAQAVKLKDAGARYILVEMEIFGAPTTVSAALLGSLYDSTSAMSNGMITSDTGYASLITYNKSVLTSMKAAGVNVIPFDDYSTFMYLVENYTAFGLTDYGISHVACNTEVATLAGGWTTAACFNDGSNLHGETYATEAVAYAAALTEHLFADGSHKGPAYLRVEADVKYNLIAAPVQIGMIAESSLQSRRNLISSLQNQAIQASSKKRGGPEKLNFWVDGDAAKQSHDLHRTGFSDIESKQFSGTLGLDYAVGDGLIVGTSISALSSDVDYSNNRGNFEQDEYVLSLYSAFNHDQFWSYAAVNYGYANNDINRKAPMGITTQSVNGDTHSNNLSATLSTGYKFKTKVSDDFNVTHGPFLGVTYQKVELDGFTESADATALALSFKDYNLKSFEAEVGYQFKGRLGICEPYLSGSLRHEFEDTENRVTAAITSSSDYSQDYYIYMPTKNVNYGNIKVGSNFDINDNLNANAYIDTAYSESEKIYQNIFAGLNYSF